jgi:hypothetical protein
MATLYLRVRECFDNTVHHCKDFIGLVANLAQWAPLGAQSAGDGHQAPVEQQLPHDHGHSNPAPVDGSQYPHQWGAADGHQPAAFPNQVRNAWHLLAPAFDVNVFSYHRP